MARPTAFQSTINKIVAAATAEIAAAIRSALATEAKHAAAPPSRAAASKAPAKKARTWPTCSEAGCPNKYFPRSGKSGLCYQHFLASGGEPSGRKPAGAKPAAKKAPTKKIAPTSKKRGRAAAESNGAVDAVLAFIAAHPGLRTGDIYSRVKLDGAAVRAALATLRETKKVKTSGVKRGTRYREA